MSPSRVGGAVEVTTVTARDQTLLDGIRSVLSAADEALLCVAFAHPRGVHLIANELRRLSTSARLVVTTTFDQTGGTALALAAENGVQVRTLNPGGGTYHPKVYLGHAKRDLHAVVGSANLTGGLICNVEVGVLLRGPAKAPPLARLHDWAEETWERARPWMPDLGEATGEDELEPMLRLAIDDQRRRDPIFRTLGRTPKPNRIVDLTPTDVFVETERSRTVSGGAEPIPAWMFNVAWDYLQTHGHLTNGILLNHLRVHRSSAVCAILARVPGVVQERGREITLTYPIRAVDSAP